MNNDADIILAREEEVCHIIGKAVVDLRETGQPVNQATLAMKLVNMADQDDDDERILLYWMARRALTPSKRLTVVR